MMASVRELLAVQQLLVFGEREYHRKSRDFSREKRAFRGNA
jgi:hypothetical protein